MFTLYCPIGKHILTMHLLPLYKFTPFRRLVIFSIGYLACGKIAFKSMPRKLIDRGRGCWQQSLWPSWYSGPASRWHLIIKGRKWQGSTIDTKQSQILSLSLPLSPSGLRGRQYAAAAMPHLAGKRFFLLTLLLTFCPLYRGMTRHPRGSLPPPDRALWAGHPAQILKWMNDHYNV